MMADQHLFSRLLAIAGAIALTCLSLFLLWPASEIFLILFAAILLAIFINGLASLVPCRSALPRLAMRALVIVLLVGLFLGFFLLAGPRIGEQIAALNEQLPRAVQYLQSMMSGQPWSDWLLQLRTDNLLPSVSQLMSGATGVFSTAFEAAVHLGAVFFIGFYLALQPDVYYNGLLHLIPRKYRSAGRQLLQDLNRALCRWLLGRLVAMALVGLLTAIGLELLGIPLALLLGLIACLFYFVPYVGPIMAAVPAVLVGLLQSPMTAVKVLLVYTFILFTEGNFFTPVIQYRAVALPPAVLLTSQLFMGLFYGLFGILLATPLAVAIIVLVQVLYVEKIIGDPVRLLGQSQNTSR